VSDDEGGICANCGLPQDLCVCETIAQEEARISVTVERRKWGRLTTVVEGFDKNIDVSDLATKLKSKLACKSIGLSKEKEEEEGNLFPLLLGTFS